MLMLSCNYFASMAYLLPYLPTSAHTVLIFLYCVIDCTFVYVLPCVVVCVELLCFILARSQLQMRTCSQLAYLVK